MSSADILRTPGLPQALDDGATALDQVPQLQATIAGLQTSLDAAAAQHQADEQTIADLTAQLAKYLPATAWGVNIPHGALPAMDAAFGGIRAVRWYWPGTSGHATVRFPTAADLGGDLGSRIVVLSAKARPQDIVAGKYDGDYEQCFAAAPKDRKTRIAVRHEPENDTGYSPADLKAAWARVATIARAAGPHILLTPILMQYTLDPVSKRNYKDWLPDDYDELGFDFYPTSKAAIGTMIGRMKAAAAAERKPWFVGEVGTMGHPDLLTALAQALAAEQLPAVCYFDGGNNQISDSPSNVTAWTKGQQAA